MKKLIKILGAITLAGILVVAGVLAAQSATLTSTVTVNFKSKHAAVDITAKAYRGTSSNPKYDEVATLANVSTYSGDSAGDTVNESWAPNVTIDETNKFLTFEFSIENKGSRAVSVSFGSITDGNAFEEDSTPATLYLKGTGGEQWGEQTGTNVSGTFTVTFKLSSDGETALTNQKGKITDGTNVAGFGFKFTLNIVAQTA